jgi:hypothetical protein
MYKHERTGKKGGTSKKGLAREDRQEGAGKKAG